MLVVGVLANMRYVCVLLIFAYVCVFFFAVETPGDMNFVDAQMGRRMASRTVQEFNENIEVRHVFLVLFLSPAPFFCSPCVDTCCTSSTIRTCCGILAIHAFPVCIICEACLA